MKVTKETFVDKKQYGDEMLSVIDVTSLCVKNYYLSVPNNPKERSSQIYNIYMLT